MRMLSGLAAAALTLLLIDVQAPPAEACGVKLTIKSSQARRAVHRSSKPSHVLLVGSPPRRLERDLSAAGHDVEVVPNPGAAKRDSYAVVIVGSNDEVTQARSKFGGAVIMKRSGDVAEDLVSVERLVGRQPVAVATAGTRGTPVAVGPEKGEPIAVKPTPAGRQEVAAKDSAPPPVATKPEDKTASAPAIAAEPKRAPEPTPAPPPTDQTATTAPKTEEQHPAKPEQVKPAAAALDVEIYFGVGQSAIVGNKAALDKAKRWLNDNKEASIVIEGHADPTGNPDFNMALSQTRAESVRDALVASGVAAAHIEVVPYGDTRLKYGKADGRNRRAAIVVQK